jgi:hypothetical protein
MTTGMIRRAELRKHLKIQQQLKGITLVLVVMLLLAAYPIYLFAQSFAADPVFTELDGLDLPGWAAYEHHDDASGSRWCIQGCRQRQRDWFSERGPDETQEAYRKALSDDGWRPRAGCPQASDGIISCWKKDEYVMQMFVHQPVCAPSREPVPGATTGIEPANHACASSIVNMYILNAIDEQPQP